MPACFVLFKAEYNEVWTQQFGELEVWIEANDTMLEATKGTSPQGSVVGS